METKKDLFIRLKAEIDSIIAGGRQIDRLLQVLCDLLGENVDYYDWVGFYLVDGDTRELVLGPFVGEATDHVRIPFGMGICGQAAAVGETIVIQDVSKVTNYLACAPEVKSEIVVPIFAEGRIFGELDIDSHEIAPFSWEDREFLEYVCRRISDALHRLECPQN